MKFLLFVIALCAVGVSAFAPAGMRARSSMMMMADRIPIMAGNWKMNTDLESATALAREVVELTKGMDKSKTEVAVIPPFIFLRDVGKAIEGSGIKLGGQNSFYENKGAYTGATSAPMLKSVGVQYCLVGHSERRSVFNELDGDINHVIERLIEANITPILCIGETQEEYDLGLNREVCSLQIKKDLKDITKDQVRKIVIAYEPVWAIGTGKVATPEIAQSVHKAIRDSLASSYGQDVADEIRIQYGGSVTPESVDELMRCPDIDGALVGGASLDAKKFARIAMFEK